MSTHTTCVSICLQQIFKLCRHMLHICRPVFDTSSYCVDTSCMCVDLCLRFLLNVSTHPACVSTCLWEFLLLCRHILHVCRPVCIFLISETSSINLSNTIFLATYNISLELLWVIIYHHQNQRSNNLPLFDDDNYESWYFKKTFNAQFYTTFSRIISTYNYVQKSLLSFRIQKIKHPHQQIEDR